MNKKDNIMSILKKMGYSPKADKDGDLVIIYQMKHVYFVVDEKDEDKYVVVVYPQFADIKVGEEGVALAVCNKLTRDLKLVQAFVDQTYKTVTATCEFYYANDESLEYCLKYSLRMIGLIRGQYYQNKMELMK